MNQIVVLGAELFNKGAQAMLFTIVNEARTRFPDVKITLLSTQDYQREPQGNHSDYLFDIKPWDFRLLARQLPFVSLLTDCKFYSKDIEASAVKAFAQADLVLDASGFGLSSKFGWKRVFIYLMNIWMAKRFSRKILLLPQSFGPLEFSGFKQFLTEFFTRKLLTYPKLIFVREDEGVKFLGRYGIKNCVKSLDMVLLSSQIDMNNVYKKPPENNTLFDIESNSVALIPNQKIFQFSEQDLLSKFKVIVEQCIQQGNKVYLLRHSYEDLKYCKQIKDFFAADDNVVLIEAEFSAIELSHLISKMSYLVASRYHAIVHAFKHGVPVLTIGWAIKYNELMEHFGQSEFLLQATESICDEEIVIKVEKLNNTRKANSEKIRNTLNRERHQNLFEKVFSCAAY